MSGRDRPNQKLRDFTPILRAAMRLHFLTIPVFESAPAEAELNRFLAGHRVLAVDRQLVADGTRSAWVVCVSYVDRPEAAPSAGTSAAKPTVAKSIRDAVDYKAILAPADFELFARLRALRKRPCLAPRRAPPPPVGGRLSPAPIGIVRSAGQRARTGSSVAARGPAETRTTPATSTRTWGSGWHERRRWPEGLPQLRPITCPHGHLTGGEHARDAGVLVARVDALVSARRRPDLCILRLMLPGGGR